MALNTRIGTAVILIPIMLGGIYLLPVWAFALFMAVIALLGGWEWASLSGFDKPIERVLYLLALSVSFLVLFLFYERSSFSLTTLLVLSGLGWIAGFALIVLYPTAKQLWASRWRRATMGLFILGSMWGGFVWVVAVDPSRFLITLLLLIIWSADIGAYFVGKTFGKTKLAPEVSPGKSWEGALGGTLFTVFAVFPVVIYGLDVPTWVALDYVLYILFCVLVVAWSIIGDLVESMVKRERGFKDSGHLLPGHGGIMDRIDSMCAAAPVFVMMVLLWSPLQGVVSG
jgi:phosphatidate cytidylyltransferase